jgi:hypothetical protein
MGLAVRAKCECGYDQEFQIGGGMSSFQELCLFPVSVGDARALSRPTSCRSHWPAPNTKINA